MLPRKCPLDFQASESQSLEGQENLSSSSTLFLLLLLPSPPLFSSPLPFLPLPPPSLFLHFSKLYLFKEEFKSEIQTLILGS